MKSPESSVTHSHPYPCLPIVGLNRCIGSQVNAEASVAEDAVLEHGVVCRGCTGDHDTLSRVAADDVGCSAGRSTDHCSRNIIDINPSTTVSPRGRIGWISPDDVALNRIVRRVHHDAMTRVARNHISRAGRCTAQHVSCCATGEPNAKATITQPAGS